jgi:circadian clock protein KaiB
MADPKTSQNEGKVDAEHYVLRLYVSGATPRSVVAIKNIKEICETHLRGRYDLQVIDILQQPARARDARIEAVPTLIKQRPPPMRRLVGDLSHRDRLLVGLGLTSSRTPG